MVIKTRYFNLMKVYDETGKYLGSVQDIAIDFYNGMVTGFIINSFSLNKKKNYRDVSDVISLENVMIAKKVSNFSGMRLKEIQSIDIVNEKNVLKGVLEDLIIDERSFEIRSIIMCSGIFDRMFRGKEILLIKHCILCEAYILYKENEGVVFKTLPHIFRSVDKWEKIKEKR